MSGNASGANVSSLDGRAANPAVIEEDYCLYAMQRFRQAWLQEGHFAPAALRHYGVRGDVTLVRSLLQSRSFGATFGTFFLGDLRELAPPPPPVCPPATANGPAAAVDAGLNGDYDTPLGAILLGPMADPARRAAAPPEEQQRLHEELARGSVLVGHTPEWNKAMSGIVTVANWVTVEQRARAAAQLEAAAFFGLKAVQVPLPMLVSGCWQAAAGDLDWAPTQPSAATTAAAVGPAEYAERNWAMLAEVAETLARYIRGCDVKPAVWVRCDASYPLQRRQFHALWSLVLNGARRDPATGVVLGPNPVTAATACDVTRGETIGVLCPLLHFSAAQALGSFSSEWLGEDVVAFEVPSAECMLRQLTAQQQHGQGQQGQEQHPSARHNSSSGGGAIHCDPNETSTHDYDYGYDKSLAASPEPEYPGAENSLSNMLRYGGGGAEAEEEQSLYSYPALDGGSLTAHPAEVETSPPDTPYGRSPAAAEELRRAARVKAGSGNLWHLPADLLSGTASRWAGHYPARISLVTFVIELMRRRAMPIFDNFFFDHYAIMNYLFFTSVADSIRNAFIGYEDVLQLPLQPLGHQLSSGVYEVFERDASKYSQYREALYAYTLDWVSAANPGTSRHGRRCSAFVRDLPPPYGSGKCDGGDDSNNTMYVALLGCGRGPLIDEILSAASSLGVRVRLFAIEKNAPAAAFTALRWRCDPEWQHLAEAFGHRLTVTVADGRTVYDRRAELDLPADFGLCDVVVSELLGSFADNELSPECIEGFVAQLVKFQTDGAAAGLAVNPSLVCIPQSYTAWAAPVHSQRLEAAVAEAAVKGLTVRPEHCDDRHRAVFHSVFVTNMSRALTLAPPQVCWSFSHSWDESGRPAANGVAPPPSAFKSAAVKPRRKTSDGGDGASFERRARLTFAVPPQGRCSGFAGYFSAVLYTPRNLGARVRSPVAVHDGPASRAITIATAPVFSSRAMVDDRTAEMYSWFPCFFPLDPAAAADLPADDNFVAATVAGATPPAAVQSKSGTVEIRLDIERRVDAEAKRVWHTWRADLGGSGRAPPPISNENGWASSILF